MKIEMSQSQQLHKKIKNLEKIQRAKKKSRGKMRTKVFIWLICSPKQAS